jgi:hypothetical protein
LELKGALTRGSSWRTRDQAANRSIRRPQIEMKDVREVAFAKKRPLKPFIKINLASYLKRLCQNSGLQKLRQT